MADKHTTAFIKELTRNQRNALRVILHRDKALLDLRHALNIPH